jgi:signal transduction histidine kinase
VDIADILERIAVASSPYPLVDLDQPSVPEPGRHYPTPKVCKKVFGRGECARFYASLRDDGGRHQCPYGFSVWPMGVGSRRLAVTALVGAPRLGGDAERLRGKEYPENRAPAEAIPAWGRAIHSLVVAGDAEREAEFTRRLEALHEIRRFNQVVKVNMERACEAESPDDVDAATIELVRAHRASVLISVQLDALDLLANPASAMSFEPRRAVFYKTVDKMVRIYQVLAEQRNVTIRKTGVSFSYADVDNRTIHIIPSVFIDNAIKYSQPGETVDVHVSDDTRAGLPVITVEVQSNGPSATSEEEQALFLRRGRGSAAEAVAQGSGLGLTLAKIVADQHKGWYSATQKPFIGGRARWTFRFQIPRV